MGAAEPVLKNLEAYQDQFFIALERVRRRADEKGVHDLRVSARRLRAALELLQPFLKSRRTARVRRRLKRILKRLGPLRDVHVHLALSRQEKTAGVMRKFSDSLRRSEKAEAKKLSRYFDSSRKKRIRSALRRLCKRAVLKLRETDAALMRTRVEDTIRNRRRSLDQARANLSPSKPRSLHAVRIAVKKLRYTLEAAGTTVKARSGEGRRLRVLQSRLGGIHDLQILQRNLKRWAGRRSSRERAQILKICLRLESAIRRSEPIR